VDLNLITRDPEAPALATLIEDLLKPRGLAWSTLDAVGAGHAVRRTQVDGGRVRADVLRIPIRDDTGELRTYVDLVGVKGRAAGLPSKMEAPSRSGWTSLPVVGADDAAPKTAAGASLLVCEGVTDWLAARQAINGTGWAVVALPGASRWRQAAEELDWADGAEIRVVADDDEAGRRMMDGLTSLLRQQGRRAMKVEPPEQGDLADCWTAGCWDSWAAKALGGPYENDQLYPLAEAPPVTEKGRPLYDLDGLGMLDAITYELGWQVAVNRRTSRPVVSINDGLWTPMRDAYTWGQLRTRALTYGADGRQRQFYDSGKHLRQGIVEDLAEHAEQIDPMVDALAAWAQLGPPPEDAWPTLKHCLLDLWTSADPADPEGRLLGYAADYLAGVVAARAIQPGAHADTMPLLGGPAGIGKSMVLPALLPTTEDLHMDCGSLAGRVQAEEQEANLIAKGAGKALMEWAEFRVYAGKDSRVDEVKRIIDETSAERRQLYQDLALIVTPRTFALYATTNHLHGAWPYEAGLNRRILPVAVELDDSWRTTTTGELDWRKFIEKAARSRPWIWGAAYKAAREQGGPPDIDQRTHQAAKAAVERYAYRRDAS